MSNIPWQDTLDLATLGNQEIRARASAWRAWREARRARRVELRAQREARYSQSAGRRRPADESAAALYTRTVQNDPVSSMAFFR